MMKLNKVAALSFLLLSLCSISYAKQGEATEKSALNASPYDLKIGEEHTAQVGDATIHFKRVPPISNAEPSAATKAELKKAKPIMEQARQAPDKQSLFIYTPEFAKRFNLDMSEAQPLGHGMYAMELIIEKDNDSDILHDFPDYIKQRNRSDEVQELVSKAMYAIDLVAPHGKPANPSFNFDCYLNLYVDSQLPISYAHDSKIMEATSAIDKHTDVDKHASSPLDIVTRAIISIKPLYKEPGFNWSLLKTAYKSSENSAQNDMHHKVFFSDRLGSNGLWQKKPIFYATRIRQYKKDLVPGVNYISLGPFINCYKMTHVMPRGYVLLEKQGKPYYGPYDEWDNLDLNDFYYFMLPKSLLEWPPLQLALKREDNTMIFDPQKNMFYMNND